MAETLQHLIDRIHQDGIAKAETQAQAILDDAKRKAAQILADAQAEARTRIERAQHEATLGQERSTRAIGQAARDVVIAVHRAVSTLVQETLGREVAAALNDDTLARLVERAVSAYTTTAEGRVDILLEPGQQQAVLDLVRTRLADALRKGVQVRPDPAIVSGFRVVLVDRHIEHDFTGESIAQALSQVLRPHQAEVLRRALDSMDGTPTSTRA